MHTVTISAEKLQQILQGLKDAKADGNVDLSEHLSFLIAIVESVSTLFTALAGGCGICDIRKLFGIKLSKERDPSHDGKGHAPKDGEHTKPADQNSCDQNQQNIPESEQAAPTSAADAAKPTRAYNANHPGKAGVDDYPDAKTCQHYHEYLKPGDVCPDCGKGKLYQDRPRMQILFTGSPCISPVKHILNDLRCGLCKAIFPAKASEDAATDGLGKEDRYGYSAIAMIAIMKYFSDLPLHRNQRLHGLHAINLPATSQFDQIEKLANALQPIDKTSAQRAAYAQLYMADDASGRILSKSGEFKTDRTSGKQVYRDGCHSSVVIAFDGQGRPLVRIRTDIIHAGEWLDEILKARPAELQSPMIMWDRSSANSVTVCEYIDLGCNQHARQNFKEQEQNHPKLIRPILDQYQNIFRNDALTIDMSPSERLEYHKQYSQPLFDSIINTCHQVLQERLLLPNSDLAQPFQYMVKHEKALRGFLEYESAPVSNNLTERTIIYLVLLRKNVHFFKTVAGARVADVILSVGLSAFYLGVNLFHYFRLVLAHQEDVRKNPENWLPWTFLERYPEYEIQYKSRRRSWPPDSRAPAIALAPPK